MRSPERGLVPAFVVLASACLAGCSDDQGILSAQDPAPAAERWSGRSATHPEFLSPAKLEALGLGVRWKADIRSRPVHLYLGDRLCYVETDNHQVHALDRHRGFYTWIFPLRGPLQVPPGDGPDALYLVSGNVLFAVGGAGNQLWAEPLSFRPVTAPVVGDAYLAVGASDHTVYIYRLKEPDSQGEGVFRKGHSKSWHSDAGGELKGPPLLPSDDPDQLIAASGAGVLTSRSLQDGSLRWRYPYQGSIGGILAGLAYDVVPTPGDGKAAGRTERTLYVGALDHALDVVDPAGGVLLARALLTDGVEEQPLIYSRVVPGEAPEWTLVRDIFCVSRNGQLFAFRVEDAHKVERDENHKPKLNDKQEPLWVPEDKDGDDVTGGDLEVPAAPSPDAAEGDEANRPKVPHRHPIHWQLRERWSMKGVARVVCRGRAGLYVLGKDNRLRLLDDSGAERWSCPLDGVVELPVNPINPFRAAGETPALYLLDAAGSVWCLEEK